MNSNKDTPSQSSIQFCAQPQFSFFTNAKNIRNQDYRFTDRLWHHAGYAGILFLVTILLSSTFNWRLSANPFVGQLVGFITLTFPVFMYSYMTENSRWKGTIGKKLLKLAVLTDRDHTSKRILIRNILKYLPWELAHTGVHWIMYYSSNEIAIPLWTWILLILPQLIVIGYFVSIAISKGQGSLYDRIAGTKVVMMNA